MSATENQRGGALPTQFLLEHINHQAPLEDPVRAYLGSVGPASREAAVKRLRAVAKLMKPHRGRASSGIACAPTTWSGSARRCWSGMPPPPR